MNRLFALAILTSLPSFALSQSSTWPQFRGPNGSGIAESQKPPVEFGPDKNVKWKVPVPEGISSPIVVGDLLVMTAFADGKLCTIAYNRAYGNEAWRAVAPAAKIEPFLKNEGSPAASTPATDGQRIVSYFGSCGLYCHDLAGKLLWKHEMPMAVLPGNFGSGTSPVFIDGAVVLVRDQTKDGKIIALDAASGSMRWEMKRQSPVSYSTPIALETPAGKQIVAAGHGRMIGYDLASGAEKWSVAGMPSAVCTSPVALDGVVYFAGWSPGGPDDSPENQMPSFDVMLKQLDKDNDGAISREEAKKGFDGFFDSMDANKDGKITRDEYEAVLKFMADGKNSAFAVKVSGGADAIKSNVLWTHTKGLPYIASAIVYRGQCVTVKEGGIVTACDAKTGKELYRERVAASGAYYASPVAANGHIYLTARDDGTVTVLKAGTEKPEVVVRNPKLGERVSATPAIADNTLYIRTEKHLYAFSSK